MLSLVEHEKSFITSGPGLWAFRQTLMLSYQDATKNTEIVHEETLDNILSRTANNDWSVPLQNPLFSR